MSKPDLWLMCSSENIMWLRSTFPPALKAWIEDAGRAWQHIWNNAQVLLIIGHLWATFITVTFQLGRKAEQVVITVIVFQRTEINEMLSDVDAVKDLPVCVTWYDSAWSFFDHLIFLNLFFAAFSAHIPDCKCISSQAVAVIDLCFQIL